MVFNRYLRELIAKPPDYLSSEEIAEQISQTRDDLAELASAQSDGRVPDLDGYELYDEEYWDDEECWDDEDEEDDDDDDVDEVQGQPPPSNRA